MRIEGAGALVAGGASGLGAATARRLVAEGARVTIADLDAEAGQGLADDLGAVNLIGTFNVLRWPPRRCSPTSRTRAASAA